MSRPVRPLDGMASAGSGGVAADPPVALYSVPEVCGLLRISRWSFYRLVNNRDLRTITIGRRRFVVAGDLHCFIQQLQETAP